MTSWLKALLLAGLMTGLTLYESVRALDLPSPRTELFPAITLLLSQDH